MDMPDLYIHIYIYTHTQEPSGGTPNLDKTNHGSKLWWFIIIIIIIIIMI